MTTASTPALTLTALSSTVFAVADNGAGLFTWPNGQTMRITELYRFGDGEDGDIRVHVVPRTKAGRDHKGHHGTWMLLQQLPTEMVERICAVLFAPASTPFSTTPAIEAEMDRNAASWAADKAHAELVDEVRDVIAEGDRADAELPARFPQGATVTVYGGYSALVTGYDKGRVVVERPGGAKRRIAPAGLALVAPDRAAAELADRIRAAYRVTEGRDGFLSDPGGWIAYLGLTEDHAMAAAAIELIRAETA